MGWDAWSLIPEQSAAQLALLCSGTHFCSVCERVSRSTEPPKVVLNPGLHSNYRCESTQADWDTHYSTARDLKWVP